MGVRFIYAYYNNIVNENILYGIGNTRRAGRPVNNAQRPEAIDLKISVRSNHI